MSRFDDKYLKVVRKYANKLNTFCVLKICTDNDELRNAYIPRIEAHNTKLLTDPYPDSGFDLLVPTNTDITIPFESSMIDFQIKTEMLYYNGLSGKLPTSPFYLFPRSSISKTPLILANHTGVIDSGYRGNIKGAFKWLKPDSDASENYLVEKHTRLLQISHPSLCPIFVTFVEKDELSETSRNDGGFGSTGK